MYTMDTFFTLGQADHIEQPKEEECFVFVNAGVAERKHLDRRRKRGAQGHYPIRCVVAKFVFFLFCFFDHV